MKEEITKDQKEIHSQTADQIKRVEAQLKAAMIELEDLRNRSMRSTLVFKNIREERNETWEDTCHILSNFFTTKLDLSYTKEFIDSMISRAHRGIEKEEGNNDRQQHRRVTRRGEGEVSPALYQKLKKSALILEKKMP